MSFLDLFQEKTLPIIAFSAYFSSKSGVNLKNEHNHNVNESMMKKDLSGGG